MSDIKKSSVTIKVSQLLIAFEAAKKVITKKAVIPVLENYKIVVDGKQGKAFVHATNFTSSLQIEIAAWSLDNFTFLLPFKSAEFLSKLDKDGEVILEYSWTEELGNDLQVIQQKDCSLNISQAKDKTKNATTSIFAFVKDTVVHERTGLMIVDAGKFISKLKIAREFTGKNEIREALMGVCVKPEMDTYKMIATDANRLIVLDLKCESRRAPQSDYRGEIIPVEALNILQSLGKLECAMTIATGISQQAKESYDKQLEEAKKKNWDTKNIRLSTDLQIYDFEFKGLITQMITRRLDENFPDYTQVIPVDSPYKVSVPKTALIKVMDKAMLFCNKSTWMGKFTPATSELKVYSSDMDFETEYDGSVPMQEETPIPDSFAIGFNMKMLTETLKSKALEDEDVSIQMTSPNRAGVIPFTGGLVLIMPLMLEA